MGLPALVFRVRSHGLGSRLGFPVLVLAGPAVALHPLRSLPPFDGTCLPASGAALAGSSLRSESSARHPRRLVDCTCLPASSCAPMGLPALVFRARSHELGCLFLALDTSTSRRSTRSFCFNILAFSFQLFLVIHFMF
jgi:hypothetical protein